MRGLQYSAAFKLANGLAGMNERQVSSGPMKSDGAGKSWYQPNQPIWARWRESYSRLAQASSSGMTCCDARYPSRSSTDTRYLPVGWTGMSVPNPPLTTVTLAPAVPETRTSCSARARSGAAQAPLGLGLIAAGAALSAATVAVLADRAWSARRRGAIDAA
jgi:hypothetical protein